MAKKRIGFGGIFCPHCGARQEKGVDVCPSCGKLYSIEKYYKGVPALGAAGIGWSERADDESFKRHSKKTKKTAFIAMLVVSVLIAAVIWFTSGMTMDRIKTDYLMIVGPLAIIWVFWIIWAAIEFGKSKGWEGTVTKKEKKEYENVTKDEDGHRHVEYSVFYIVNFKDTRGKKRKLTQRNTGAWYGYLKEGDRVRYHGKYTSYYEKYDKSGTDEIPCAGCGKGCDARADYCDKCGCILLKAPSAK